ncbi:MAG: alpha-L-rhamnosidase, partial [Planctomycetota bacterium]
FRWRFPSDVPNSRLAGGEQWMDVARFDAARDAEQSHWSRASVSESDEHRTLEPTPLPEMLHRRWRGGRVCNVTGPLEAAEWQSWWTGQVDRIVVPAESKAEVLIDLDDYLCAFVSLHVEQGAGATVDVAWAEALVAGVEEPHFEKGQRDEVEGKRFIGRADTFVFDGQPRTAETLWWRAGRFIQLTIRTGDEPLILLALQFDETRYPLDWRDLPPTGDSEFDAAVPLMQRSIETCVHETFMDCPYYEQIQYLGDTRLQALVTYTLCDDDRPGMRAIKLFAAAQRPDGLLPSRLPCTKDQLIPGFCLAWVGMLHDLAIWRGRPEFVSDMLPASRRLVDAFARLVGDDDLLGPLPDWRFVDWVPTWQNGVPADTQDTPDAIHNAWLVIALRQLAQFEAWVGDADISRSHAALAERLSAAGKRAFWSDQRSLFSNAPDRDAFSEHAQCLAVLADWITGDDAGDLLRRCSDADVAKTTIYFRHYRFEALTHVGLSDSILDELDEWRDLPARGLKTTPEMPEPTRSDNHAWGAHPLFHVVAPRLGLRPTPLPHTPTPQ